MSLLWKTAVDNGLPFICVTEHLKKGEDGQDRSAPRRVKKTRHSSWEEAKAEGDRRVAEEPDIYPNLREESMKPPRGYSYWGAIWKGDSNKPGVIFGPKIED